MFDSFKLSTSHIILISLFILILVIALLGYIETSKINSRIERVSYQLSKQTDKCMNMCPINFKEKNKSTKESTKVSMDEPKTSSSSGHEEKVILTESKQAFSPNVPEEDSAFSLGAIFKNLDSTGKPQNKIEELEETGGTDKIADDSEFGESSGEYTDEYSSEEEDKEDKEDKDDKIDILKDELTINLKKYEEHDLNTKSLKELKTLCDENKVAKYGNKDKMIDRLLNL